MSGGGNISPNNINVNVLVDSKKEYTHRIVDLLTPILYNDFYDMFKEAEHAIETRLFPKKNNKEVFTMMLQSVKNWKDDERTMQIYARRITEKCSWIMDLLKTIMVLNTMVLAAIRNNDQPEQINVEVPEAVDFVYELYKCVSVKLPVSIFVGLYSQEEDKIEKSEERMLSVIEKCIVKVISDMLPIKNLIATYTQGWNTNSFTCDQSVEATTVPPPPPAPSTVQVDQDITTIPDTNVQNLSDTTPATNDDTSAGTTDTTDTNDVVKKQESMQNIESGYGKEDIDESKDYMDKNSVDQVDSDDNDDDIDGIGSLDVSDDLEEDDDDKVDNFARQAVYRQREIRKKLNRMKIKKQTSQPIGKQGVPYDSDMGDKRKTVKISKDVHVPKPSTYLGNDFEDGYDD